MEVIKSRTENEGEAFQSSFNAFVEKYACEYDCLEAFDYKGGNVKIEAFLHNSSHNINLMFGTENEQNLDMSSITEATSFARLCLKDVEEFEECSDNALSYLIHQQGHTLSEMYDRLYAKEPNENECNFINNIVNEVNDATYEMNELTALVAVDGNKLVEILDTIANKEDYIIIYENATLGLFNEWQGAGSDFEITLEKPAVFPASMVRNIQIEGAGKQNDGYTVNEVYGFVSSVWAEKNIGTTILGSEIIKENMQETYEKLNSYIKEGKNKEVKKQKPTEIDL